LSLVGHLTFTSCLYKRSYKTPWDFRREHEQTLTDSH